MLVVVLLLLVVVKDGVCVCERVVVNGKTFVCVLEGSCGCGCGYGEVCE